jgi:hypothetical protein
VASNYSDNNIRDCGIGQWTVVLYNPAGPCGLYTGILMVGKDFHVIYGVSKDTGDKKVIATFPSQNVAYVYDHRYVKGVPNMGAE